MKTSVGSLEVFLVFAVILRSAECAITAWSKPVINAAPWNGTLVEKINDGVKTGTATGITITATGGTISAYTKVSQTPKAPALAINGTTGVVTVTSGTVSYSSAASFILVVSATDAGGTVTATVTLNVNAAPVISSHSSSVCIQDASTHGVNLIDLKATDSNSGTTFTWAIAASGNSGAAFANTAGLIAVATGKTLNKATTPSYTLVITAADDSSTPLTATTTLTASVQTTCSSTPAPTTIAASVQTTPSNSAAAVAISLETVLVVFLVKGFC